MADSSSVAWPMPPEILSGAGLDVWEGMGSCSPSQVGLLEVQQAHLFADTPLSGQPV